MAVTTIDGVRVETQRTPGFFARLFERMAEGQMRRARGMAKEHLLALDDEDLEKLGHTRDEIRRWESMASWI
jgi:hypothetical protein